ncbi:hypothetical protein OsI_11746 [Oryza sativa Indica Group]|uniref:Uncharacterized protein n=1 Tax=Oryza sativa subsp. indica TaxID=39946 RepID=A2XH72_ORYSI|nr:hypothetical protein OsI_11746 [Oryza sativa Indica Group]
MLPTVVDDPSAAAAADAAVGADASSSFPDADVYGNGDSDDIDFPSEPKHATNQAFSSAADAAAAAGPGGGGGAGSGPSPSRSPHEQAIFEIARGIWRPTSDKHGRDADSDDDALPDAAAAVAVPAPANGEVRSPSSTRAQQRRGRRRRTAAAAAATATAADASEPPQPYPPAPAPAPVKAEDALPHFFPQGAAVTATAHVHGVDPASAAASAAANAEGGILAPLFKEMVRAMLTAGMAPPSLEPPAPGIPMKGERWRQQRILELEVYLRRIDLLQDQVRTALEELKSTPPATQ